MTRVREGITAVPREPRVVVACRVTFEHDGRTVAGVSQDISKSGVFMRTETVLPVGETVELSVHLPSDSVLTLRARVVHVLCEVAARALSRFPGIGFEFVKQEPGCREQLDAYLDELVSALSVRPEPEPRITRIVIADGSTRLLERLSTALGNAGFVVTAAANGAEAYAACLHDPPDLVLAATEMPVVDGWRLVAMLGARPTLAQIPVALMSEDAGDMTRLKAYRLGVVDFIPKPFTAAEVCIRMRRLARAHRATTDRVVLRGTVAEIGTATLLSMLDFERKTGILTVLNEAEVAWLSVDQGRVVKVESAEDSAADSLTMLRRVLDWTTGDFEFVSCEVYDQDEVGMTTTHLLLEHARQSDEESAGPSGAEQRASDA